MSTFISEPGTRLGGRYRLEDRVSASGGWAAWKAIDETLARPVTVLTFARGFPRIGDVVTAARAASRLTDARLAQVFDVEEDWDHAYVVMEWVAGDSLEDLLADGPLDPGQGAEIIAQAAEALAAAHAAGVAHLCLNPDSLRWTAGGGVKIVGLGIDAALTGVTADDPALADTHGLGKLLYAALTAHWPGGEWPSLPPAPEVDGHLCSPRQVRAGVPTRIDDVACRALFQRDAAGGPALTTPATLATALNRVVPAPAAPPPAARRGYTAGPGPAPLAPGPPYGQHGGPPRRGGRDPMAGRGSGGTRSAVVIVGVLVLGVVGAAIWAFGHHSSAAPPHAGPSTNHPTPSTIPATVLKPQSAAAFGPGGGDNAGQAGLAIDASQGTDWTTDSYQGSARFGNLYDGTGLMLDMGTRVNVSSVTVIFGTMPGTHVRIEVGNSASGTGDNPPPGFTTLGHSSNAAGAVTFTGHRTESGQFILIWFTRLAQQPGQSGHFQADVFNVVVKGSS